MNTELKVISKKLQIFLRSEMPLLVLNGFLNELSVFPQLSANTRMQYVAKILLM